MQDRPAISSLGLFAIISKIERKVYTLIDFVPTTDLDEINIIRKLDIWQFLDTYF